MSVLEKKATQLAEADWLAAAVLDDFGNVVPNVANALLALRRAPDLRGIIAFDEMQRRPVIRHSDGSFRPIEDNDTTQIQEWMQRHGMPRIGAVTVHQAIDEVAAENPFHPVRNYLESMPWDGMERIDTFFSSYFNAEQTDYSKAIGRMFLIAMVARIYEPGCKADYMVILEGDQGLRKSTACRVLAGDAWFSDSLPDISNKDAMQHLRGKWLIEVAELAAMSKAETRDLKMFVTRQVEKYRPPYGRREVIEPRQCLFVGTTNDDRYLKDETGARRFWPMKVGEPDIEALTRARDQLLAEAVHRYRAGAQWWPDAGFERAIIKPEQDARYDNDVWEEVVRPCLADRERVTVQEIATNVIGLPVAQIKRSEQNRIISILGRLRWTMRRSGSGRYYYPPKLTTVTQ